MLSAGCSLVVVQRDPWKRLQEHLQADLVDFESGQLDISGKEMKDNIVTLHA